MNANKNRGGRLIEIEGCHASQDASVKHCGPEKDGRLGLTLDAMACLLDDDTPVGSTSFPRAALPIGRPQGEKGDNS